MENKYTVADHGDLLERQGAMFIQTQFQNYERVWSVYIGNTGNNHQALLPGYPDEAKRKNFAEHSYTTFESFFMIQQILESKIFESEIDSFEKYVELNHSFVAFFTYLGRIRDMAKKSAEILGYDCRSFIARLQEFYEARCIVLHGKKVPILVKDGFLTIPVLSTRNSKGTAWNDEKNNWPDAEGMKTEFLADTCETYFHQLLDLVNREYGKFFDLIMHELKTYATNLIFDRSMEGDLSSGLSSQIEPSGSTVMKKNVEIINVYNLNGSLYKGQ